MSRCKPWLLAKRPANSPCLAVVPHRLLRKRSSCATQFITSFGQQAYRRPVAADEQADLLKLFDAVRKDDAFTFNEAIGAIAKAMLAIAEFPLSLGARGD